MGDAVRTLNDYDRRELAVMRGALRSAVQMLEWIGEGRSQVETELRAGHVRLITARVNIKARNFERRWRALSPKEAK